MSDRCQTHKARACQKCAGDAGVHPGIRAQWREDFSSEIVRCSWSEEAHLAFLDALEAAEADARRWKQIAKNFSEDCTVTEREVDRLAGVVAKVRELADQWKAGRSPNGGRQLLSVTDVVDRLNAALEQADRDAAEWREIHRGMRDDRDPS